MRKSNRFKNRPEKTRARSLNKRRNYEGTTLMKNSGMFGEYVPLLVVRVVVAGD